MPYFQYVVIYLDWTKGQWAWASKIFHTHSEAEAFEKLHDGTLFRIFKI